MKKNYTILTTVIFLLLVQLSNAQACFKEIRAGRNFVIALKEDNTLWAWGSNANHQLGDGTTTSRLNAVQVGTSTWLKFTVGDYQVLAIKSDGTLWGWGKNDIGQLSDITTATDVFVPTQIGTDNHWAQVTTGRQNSTGIKTDGTMWAWGYNAYGQLGDGTIIDKLTPTQIGTANNWAKVYSGYYHTLAIKNNGTLWTWGANDFNGSGIGTGSSEESILVPTQIGIDTNWVEIAAGNVHSLAMKSNGTIWSCGANFTGQLGNGTLIDAEFFTQIGTDTDWQKIAVGLAHNLVIKTNGTLWSWGLNNSGQIGNGTIDTTNSVLLPYQVGTSTDWLSVSTGSHNSFAFKANGDLWSWGFDGSGMLGDLLTISRPTPALVDCSTLATEEIQPNFASVKVYPNPTTSLLNIATRNLQAEKIELYDIQGRLILSEKMTGTEQQLDISNLENGTYLLKVSAGDKSETIKVIKN